MFYRYRFLILSVLIGIILNSLLAFTDSLLLKTISLVITLLFFFLALFAKRGIKTQDNRQEHQSMKIYL